MNESFAEINSLQRSTRALLAPFSTKFSMDSSSSSEETIMAALINIHPHHFAHLTRSLTTDLRLQHHRLAFLLLSPLHFSHTLSYLHSLSLSQKTVLLARLLLRSLSKLLQYSPASAASCHAFTSPTAFELLRLRDFDAALLLMAMCEVYDRNDHESSRGLRFDWRLRIAEHLVSRTLCPAELGAQGWGVVGRYVDAAVRCRRLLEVVSGGRAGEEKAGTEVAASVAVVVSLPSVECRREGWECVVCKEEMEVGRDVCVLPCEHGFHWGCILPWLRKRSTCPCCRFELPTDDVFCEIERVWRSAVRMGTTASTHGES